MITIDGHCIRRRAHTVMDANLGRITGRVELVTGTGPECGTLQVAILRSRGLWSQVQVAAAAVLGDAE